MHSFIWSSTRRSSTYLGEGLPLAVGVDGDASGNAEGPRFRAGSALETGQAPVDTQEGFLQQVGCGLGIASKTFEIAAQGLPMLLNDRVEIEIRCGLVGHAGLSALHGPSPVPCGNRVHFMDKEIQLLQVDKRMIDRRAVNRVYRSAPGIRPII
jgi:hypothetical protein